MHSTGCLLLVALCPYVGFWIWRICLMMVYVCYGFFLSLCKSSQHIGLVVLLEFYLGCIYLFCVGLAVK